MPTAHNIQCHCLRRRWTQGQTPGSQSPPRFQRQPQDRKAGASAHKASIAPWTHAPAQRAGFVSSGSSLSHSVTSVGVLFPLLTSKWLSSTEPEPGQVSIWKIARLSRASDESSGMQELHFQELHFQVGHHCFHIYILSTCRQEKYIDAAFPQSHGTAFSQDTSY